MKTWLRRIVLVLVALLAVSNARAVRQVPANWRHELLITRPVGYKAHEFLVTSSIYRATQPEGYYYNIEKKVSEFSKAHTEILEAVRDGQRVREIFSITLYETSNPKELRAEFTHEVFEGKDLKLRFSGVTILPR